uniref:Uncharacterized protein n=1 Tax=Pyxicephalus adspersus TaxID=30357 RepID=A0AAV3AHB6_PYXAD|nr:TPA: hypothetical protein GDO54_018029 [Pyxicephalus adspersus]
MGYVFPLHQFLMMAPLQIAKFSVCIEGCLTFCTVGIVNSIFCWKKNTALLGLCILKYYQFYNGCQYNCLIAICHFTVLCKSQVNYYSPLLLGKTLQGMPLLT